MTRNYADVQIHLVSVIRAYPRHPRFPSVQIDTPAESAVRLDKSELELGTLRGTIKAYSRARLLLPAIIHRGVVHAGIMRTIEMRPKKESNCSISHPQIISGPCPWCGETIGDLGQPVANGSSQETQTRWNPAAVAAGIRSDEVGFTTVLGLGRGWQFDEEMLPVFELAVRHSDQSVANMSEEILRRPSLKMTAADVERLETLCGTPGCELAAHLMLTGYYFFFAQHFYTPEAAASRRRHVLWTIANAPCCRVLGYLEGRITSEEDSAAFIAAKSLWCEHITARSSDARILINAAVFYSYDEPDYSRSLLHRARTLGSLGPGVGTLLFRLEHEWNRSDIRLQVEPQNLRWSHNN